jgi:hypothetical protein
LTVAHSVDTIRSTGEIAPGRGLAGTTEQHQAGASGLIEEAGTMNRANDWQKAILTLLLAVAAGATYLGGSNLIVALSETAVLPEWLEHSIWVFLCLWPILGFSLNLGAIILGFRAIRGEFPWQVVGFVGLAVAVFDLLLLGYVLTVWFFVLMGQLGLA